MTLLKLVYTRLLAGMLAIWGETGGSSRGAAVAAAATGRNREHGKVGQRDQGCEAAAGQRGRVKGIRHSC
jgi:hypothetical protein